MLLELLSSENVFIQHGQLLFRKDSCDFFHPVLKKIIPCYNLKIIPGTPGSILSCIDLNFSFGCLIAYSFLLSNMKIGP